jgi:hypothetical protein
MCYIVAVNELPAGAMPCLGHCGDVADPEADAGIVLKRLVIEAEGGDEWQCVEPFAARVGGQAVEESVVTFARSELEQLLRVCGMKGTSHGTCGVAEVLRMMLYKRGDLGRGNGRVGETKVSPGGACGAIGGHKGAQTWGGSLRSSFSACAGGNEGRCDQVGGQVQDAKPRGAQRYVELEVDCGRVQAVGVRAWLAQHV